jgi:glycosyltransferase involved in cell wall biosynthesis
MKTSNEENKKVSAVIPAYNEEENIKAAINSFLKQTYNNLEIVVVNDGSVDSTKEILDDNYYNEKNVRVIHQPNKGFTKALNRGIRESSGEYVARLDADDRCYPERIEKQVQFLNKNPEVAVLGCDYLRVDKIRQETYVRKFPRRDEKIRKEMSKYIPLAHSSVIFRKSVIEEVGGYNERIDEGVEDLELWVRVAKNHKLANLPETLVMREIRGNSYWHSNFGAHARNLCLAKINARAIRELSLPYFYYVFPLLRMIYSWLPTPLKRILRRNASGIDESDVSPNSQDEEMMMKSL